MTGRTLPPATGATTIDANSAQSAIVPKPPLEPPTGIAALCAQAPYQCSGISTTGPKQPFQTAPAPQAKRRGLAVVRRLHPPTEGG